MTLEMISTALAQRSVDSPTQPKYIESMKFRPIFKMASIWLGLSLALGNAVRAADAPSPEQVEFFEQRVRPVFVEQCQACHGEIKQEGGLRLDGPEGLKKGGDSGAVLVSGKPAESLLIEAVRQTGDLKMPPPPKPKLTADSISALEQWIADGAHWPAPAVKPTTSAVDYRQHWAFQRIEAKQPPAVKHASWIATDVDRFILAKLEAAGLRGAPLADRRTLVRRASYDLIGLPPTPAEVEHFEKDSRPTQEAFADVVDRLLASPHYGERWGRYWLDVARYADNKGYVFFEEPSYPWGYAYRDWVIRAFNDDLPFDQFVMQQLAADQLPTRSDALTLAALGFITIGGHFMNNVHDIFDDRIDAVGRGFLGLTVACARCHDHKYDPIPQTDYYGMYGIFRSASEPTVPPMIDKIPETEAYEYYELELAKRENRLEKFLDRKHAELVSGGRTRTAEYLLAAYASRDQPSTEDFMLLIPEGDLHPLVVQRYWLYLQKTRKGRDPVWGAWHGLGGIPESEFSTQSATVLEELTRSADAASPINSLVMRALQSGPLASMNDVAKRYGDLFGAVDQQWKSAIESTGVARRPDHLADPEAEQLRQVLYAVDAPANVPRVAGWGVLTLLPDRGAQAEYQRLVKELESWMIHAPHAPTRAMVLVDDPEPYSPRVFLRGNPNRAGDPAPRRFLKFLSREDKPFSQGSGRLELAREIVDRRNPLTARVFVNRIWQHHFGSGMVRTPSDFGMRAEPPSHPELLDYLAHRFIEEGWSVKKLHRLILASTVYQQESSSVDSVGGATGASQIVKGAQVDPDNRLLWKMPRQRLDFESLRDSLLFASGTLDLTVGGRSVNLLAGSNRRSIYGHVDRLALPGLLRTFDFPSPDTSNAQRDQTTVAPQALYLMNGPLAFDCAKKLLARPEIAGEKDFDRRVELVYRLLFSRLPNPTERTAADEIFAPPVASRDDSAAWERYVHALLLTNEFAFVD